MRDDVVSLCVQLPFVMLIGWAACGLMVALQRAFGVIARYRAHHERLSKERAKVRTACRGVIDWFHGQVPMGEAYAMGFLAFEDLKTALRREA